MIGGDPRQRKHGCGAALGLLFLFAAWLAWVVWGEK